MPTRVAFDQIRPAGQKQVLVMPNGGDHVEGRSGNHSGFGDNLNGYLRGTQRAQFHFFSQFQITANPLNRSVPVVLLSHEIVEQMVFLDEVPAQNQVFIQLRHHDHRMGHGVTLEREGHVVGA